MSHNFAIDPSEMSAERALLDESLYAGTIVQAGAEDKDGNSLINIIEEEKPVKGKKEKEKTGKFVLRGSFTWQIALISEKAKRVLMQDAPRVFGRTMLFFDQETGQLAKNNNQIIKQLIDLFELDMQELQDAVDMSLVDGAEIPEEFSHVPNIKTLWPAAIYYRQLFSLMGQALVNFKVKAKVKKQQNFTNKEITENALDLGNMNQPSCGMLPYEEGCENDLVE